jgi:hypothetical protein
MADVTSVQTLVDNERNLVVKLCGVLDTANVAKATFVDVSALNAPVPVEVSLQSVEWSVSGNLSINLYWNATADQLFLTLAESGQMCFSQFGGLTNNAGAGVNGDVEYETVGFANPSTYSAVFTFKKIPQ